MEERYSGSLACHARICLVLGMPVVKKDFEVGEHLLLPGSPENETPL